MGGACGPHEGRPIHHRGPHIAEPAELTGQLREAIVDRLDIRLVGEGSAFLWWEVGRRLSNGGWGWGERIGFGCGRWVVVVVFGGSRERVVVFTRIGDKEGGGVKAAPLYLFSRWAPFWATAPVISPAINNLGQRKRKIIISKAYTNCLI